MYFIQLFFFYSLLGCFPSFVGIKWCFLTDESCIFQVHQGLFTFSSEHHCDDHRKGIRVILIRQCFVLCPNSVLLLPALRHPCCYWSLRCPKTHWGPSHSNQQGRKWISANHWACTLEQGGGSVHQEMALLSFSPPLPGYLETVVTCS